MSLRPVDQLGFDERVIDDPEIEAALEEREKRKGNLGAVRKAFDEADEIAAARIAELELPDGGVARVGRFRVSRTGIAAGYREFETKASSRIRITIPKEGAS